MSAIKQQAIQLRGVRVHNLKNINLDIPLRQITVLTGISGSGKSSLAFDTLYAEGQRRYIESFSTYARRFLDRLDKPDADRIDNIPPAVALEQKPGKRGPHETIGSATEIDDYLGLLLARVGRIVCPNCKILVHRENADQIAERLSGIGADRKLLIAVQMPVMSASEATDRLKEISRAGLSRAIVTDARMQQTLATDNAPGSMSAGAETKLPTARVVALQSVAAENLQSGQVFVVIDRLVSGSTTRERLTESLESALREGNGRCIVFIEQSGSAAPDGFHSSQVLVDGRVYAASRFADHLECNRCGREFCEPEPTLFNRRSPLGACHECQGTRADCSACGGTGLNHSAHSVRLLVPGELDKSPGIAELVTCPLAEFAAWLREWPTHEETVIRDLTRHLLPELSARADHLVDAGLGYLALTRPLRTLSRGEAQRVRLASILGASLVNTLYVLDEPSAGLHPRDLEYVIRGVCRLRSSGNTVVVIEHEPAFLSLSDKAIEIGPGAGTQGGRVVVSGSPEALIAHADAPTAVAFRRQVAQSPRGEPRAPTGWLELHGVSHHTLRGLDTRFPLGCLCVVAGVSGSGKSLLVHQSLYPALCSKLGLPCDVAQPAHVEKISGTAQLVDVLLVDDSPLAGGTRSNAATWLKLFDDVRRLYAAAPEAKARGLNASYFSFNQEHSGRCPKCSGTGLVHIDMQFLADVVMACPECHGTRFQREALDITWRGQSIAEVLAMTATDAFVFFRGQPRIQKRLKALKDVGLGYLTLGQPLSTLSGGEAQRLKLAAALSRRRAKSLILMDEPTIGLHPADVERLLACFEGLLSVGHSLIVIEHNLDVIRAADYVIELGPGNGPDGGRVILSGSIEELIARHDSPTGQALRAPALGVPIRTTCSPGPAPGVEADNRG